MSRVFETTFRAAIATDKGRLVELIELAGLPAKHIDEFIEGFLVAVVDERIQACGGLEIYGETGILRSFVVEPNIQRSGLGREIANRQLVAAKQAGLEALYLFTGDSSPFWEKLGFNRIPFSEWAQPARESWQYQLVNSHRAALERMGIRSMWRSLSGLAEPPSRAQPRGSETR